jgi:hypothetical protein
MASAAPNLAVPEVSGHTCEQESPLLFLEGSILLCALASHLARLRCDGDQALGRVALALVHRWAW